MRVLLFLILIFSGKVLAAPDEELLGKSRGYPACRVNPGEQHCLVGTLSHWDEHAAARKVPAGTARALRRADREPAIRYVHNGRGGDVDWFLRNHRNTGLLVMQGDTILVERYQYERKPGHRFQSYSMAKTVVGILVGIALHEKLIASIDDKAHDYATALKGHPLGDTTIRHLLTMSSGVKFREDYDGKDDSAELGARALQGKGLGGSDTVEPFRNRDRAPGTSFYYSSADSQALGLALRAAVKMPLAQYLSEKLWRPMGAEADASWLVDKTGHETGFMGINATLRDWGRLGMLLANGGELDGRQIIPAEWVKAMTRAEAPHLAVGTATRNNGYGYQTWLIHRGEPYFALLGVRGQGVFVDPASKVVVVHTAVHATHRDPSRAEQFSLFFGTVNSLGKQP